MPWLAAAAVAGPVIGGLMGNMAAAKDRAAQKAAMKKAMAELEKVGMPPDTSKALILKEFEAKGIYTPELEEDLNSSVPESEVGKITEDPALREAQKGALTSLQQRAKVGLSAEDRAALNQVRQQVQTDAQAKQAQILQEMKARGMGGSGAEFLARLQSNQMEAQNQSTASDALMGQAQERALQALAQSGNFAGNLRQQDFNNAAQKASALDERNRFLAENSISRQTRNAQALTNQRSQDWANQQEVSNKNTAQSNAETQRQNQAQADYWQNKLNYGQAKANAQVGQATQAGQQADRTAGMYAGIGSAVGTGIGGYAAQQNTNEQNALNRQAYTGKDAAGGKTGYSSDYLASDENLKNEIDYSDEDVQKWLDGLSTRILRKKM
jgi:hypothetical protein